MEKLANYFQQLKKYPLLYKLLKFIEIIYREAKAKEIFIQAMSMVYITLLSLVPFLIFSFYIITLFNFFGRIDNIINALESLILNNLATGAGEALIAYLRIFISNVKLEQLGIISFVSLVITIVFLLARIEITFNKIWEVNKNRDLLKRFISFWTFITLGTFVITLFLTIIILFAEHYFGNWFSGGQIKEESIFINFSFLFNFIVFILAYYFIPNTDVEWKSALLGGFFSGTLFILSKRFYAVYTSYLVTYNQIYGPLSVIPIFLIWLYLIWLIILLGAIISYAFQNRHNLIYLANAKKVTPALEELIALEILFELNSQQKKDNLLSYSELTDQINLPFTIINKSLEFLLKNNLIAKTEGGNYLAVKMIDQINFWDLFSNKFYQAEPAELDENLHIIFNDQKLKTTYQKLKDLRQQNFSKLKLSDLAE
ncbi:YihY/virulence factor BrkB family protein [Halanaerobium salsuginis]|uniref:Membrane protein n=1 Tax=Halanaerobium salsuginis TaxID=29563 RepID=A0A1I4ID65_9FIRM|nr:YhjD/YihY/BrkB family envelope integrity protein [Halanaerobium salsuginis]SFL52214.1 membrane protein [Halanaerobium salsuginis]